MSHKPVILILGPTAGGKTQLSLDLARRLPGTGEIISCDSMQVYRGMDVGTAKPSPHERAGIPHHLLDIIDPADDSFSVDRWLELAEQAVADIRARERWPIIIGGTNLYVQALLFGLADMPAPDPARRAQLAQLDPTALRRKLEEIDPNAAQRIHPNDRKRTIRAIEVFEQTGQPLSALQTQWEMPKRPNVEGSIGRRPSAVGATDSRQPTANSRSDVFILGIDYPVEIINRRINARVKAMVEAGFVEEVRRLHAANALGRNAREALGYKQIIDHLEGRSTLEEAIEQIKIRTRRYAKQQRTWLRRFRHHPSSVWLNAADLSPQTLADQAFMAITHATVTQDTTGSTSPPNPDR